MWNDEVIVKSAMSMMIKLTVSAASHDVKSETTSTAIMMSA
jgi:hypothetical protein